MLQCVSVRCSAAAALVLFHLHLCSRGCCVAVRRSRLQCVVVFGSVLRCCSCVGAPVPQKWGTRRSQGLPVKDVLQYVAVCYVVLHLCLRWCDFSVCSCVLEGVVLQCVAAFGSVLRFVAVCCNVLHCSVLQCVAVCCSLLQFVAVCCSVLH